MADLTIFTGIYSPDIVAMLVGGLLLTGAIAGLLAGLLGVGGGIVIVPVLYLLFTFLDMPSSIVMHLAVATSLVTIIPISISSARSHHAKGAVDLDVLKSWGPFILIGAAIGGAASGSIDSRYLQLLFGVIALYVSVSMIISREKTKPKSAGMDGNTDQISPAGRGLRGLGIAGAIGGASALMGIGGGAIAVPILSALALPVHRAVGTAAAFGFLIALPGSIGFIWSGIGVDMRPPLSLGFVSLPAAIIIFSTSMFTIRLGSRIAHALPAARLRRAFGGFLLLSALNILSGVVAN
ncbi:sulfite exporter TauE/SafE family protein [Alphaproteobacteria bacterium]|jgi:uncharacterized membrane protein YfcA|nr:sulfite exporter TauE/SafE family protein [Alphaproteobacteria bacterium]